MQFLFIFGEGVMKLGLLIFSTPHGPLRESGSGPGGEIGSSGHGCGSARKCLFHIGARTDLVVALYS